MGIILAMLAVCKLDFATPITEGFWGNIQLGRKVQSNLTLPGAQQPIAMAGNMYPTPATMGSSAFVSVPSYQAVLSPRFSNLDYGANIKYNMPDRANMAVPCDPLTFGDSKAEKFTRTPIRENFETSPPSCGKGGYGMGRDISNGYPLPPNYSNGNKQEVYDQVTAGTAVNAGEIPIAQLQTTNQMGQDQTVVWTNQLMYATAPKSRLLAQADPIRGDLHITAELRDNWAVHPNPSVDLQAGAMHVLNGDGTANNATIALISAAAGGKSTLSGVNLNEHPYTANMAMQNQANLSSAMTDLTVTAFP